VANAQTIRQTGLLSLLVCAASGYGIYIDRQTPVALDLVELQSQTGIPIPAVFGLLGISLVLWSIFGARSTSKYARDDLRTPRTKTQRAPTRSPPLAPFTRTPPTSRLPVPPSMKGPASPDGDWWAHVRSASSTITLPEGARVTFDPDRPSPVILHLELAPPERCKRAIREVASWFSQFSIPPRLRIEFDHCPEGASPRHHMVNGALAMHLERGDFKVMTDRDAVDVMFHHPDPRWNIPSVGS
jgi:hypothetical protein